MKRHCFLNILLIFSLFITALVPLCAFAADEGAETGTSSATLLFREDFEGDSNFSKTVTTETVNGNTVWVQKGRFNVTYAPDDLNMTAEQKETFPECRHTYHFVFFVGFLHGRCLFRIRDR